MARLQLILLAIGLLVAVVVIGIFGFSDVSAAIVSAGWGVLWLVVYHAVPLLADALGWAALMRGRPEPSFGMLYLIRWISESVNNLLPVAQVGGEVVRVRLAQKKGCSGAAAGASVIVDVTMGLFALMAFSLFGIVLLIGAIGPHDHIISIAIGVVIFFTLILGFFLVQRAGFIGRTGVIADKFGRLIDTRRFEALVGGAQRLEIALETAYRRRTSLAVCGFLRLASFVAGSGEVWIGLYILGFPADLTDALIINALTMAIRSAAFAIPGGLGAQEGGFLVIGTLLGLPPEISLALALLRRVREILFGLPGLGLWWLLENRSYDRVNDSAGD